MNYYVIFLFIIAIDNILHQIVWSKKTRIKKYLVTFHFRFLCLRANQPKMLILK